MTATQAPTPGPLTSESVNLLVNGDLLRVIEHGMACAGPGDLMIVDDALDGLVFCHKPNDPDYVWQRIPSSRFTFIGRPDADGWMLWSGGENPVPGQRVVLRLRSGITSGVLASEEAAWDRSSIIAFRLAPTAPVEASGSELNPATADLVDRFAAELKLKLAKAEAKYGYAADWLKTDWQDELNESLAEHLQKGDPRDVAAYCAFAWHHGWSTSDAAGHFAPALRPQPSGETRALLERIAAVRARKDFTPQHANAGLLTVLDDCAAILAFGGQQEDWRCPDCGAQADEWFDCCKNPARAEAQDEGAAGEQTDNAFKIASDLHAAYEQLIYGLPKYLEAENLTDEENMIREAYITLDVTAHRLAAVSDAHPSPTPAADADRVRIAVEALERIRGEAYAWTPSKAAHALGMIAHEAIAALKSEGK
jgi:hypothetical protein